MEIHNTRERIVAAALASEAGGQRGNSYKWARRLIARCACGNMLARAA